MVDQLWESLVSSRLRDGLDGSGKKLSRDEVVRRLPFGKAEVERFCG